MRSLNRGEAIGRLTRDIQVNDGGKEPFAFINLAVQDDYKTKEGEEVKQANFISFKAWGKTAETLAKYTSKGHLIWLEYKVKTWTKGEGQERQYFQDLVITGFQFLESKNKGESTAQGDASAESEADAAQRCGF